MLWNLLTADITTPILPVQSVIQYYFNVLSFYILILHKLWEKIPLAAAETVRKVYVPFSARRMVNYQKLYFLSKLSKMFKNVEMEKKYFNG